MKRWIRQPNYRIRQKSASAPFDEIRVMNPSRGLNLLVADILSNDKEATAGTKDIEYVEGGAARKRMGYKETGTGLANPPRGLIEYLGENDSYLLSIDGTELKKFDNGAWTSPGGATVDASANISLTSLYKYTYLWDGTNGGAVYDGTAVSRPGTMPRAKFSVVYKDWHVASGVKGQPFRVYFAKWNEPSRFTDNISPTGDDIGLNNATEVPGATVFSGAKAPRAIDINRNDGQKVVGLGFFQDVLIVFKEKSIYQLYFNEQGNFVVERISSSYGAVSHGSIQSVENDCYFLTDKGVYVLGNEPNYYAAIRTNELSSRVKPLLQRINPAHWERCRGYYWDDRYFLTVPLDQATECDTVIVYDRRFYSWAYWTNINAETFCAFKDDGDNRERFYFTEYGEPNLCEFTPNVYNDKGAPIEAVFVTRAFEGKMVDRTKYWYVIRPIFRLTTGIVQISFVSEDGTIGRPASVAPIMTGGLGVDQLGAALYGTSQQDTFTDGDLGLAGGGGDSSSSETDSSHRVYDIGIGIDARTMKIRFSNDGLNETFTLLGWVLLYQEKDFDNFDGNYTIR